MLKKIFLIAITSLFFLTPYLLAEVLIIKEGGEKPTSTETSLSDHKAKVFNIEGDGGILKRGGDSWRALTKETLVEEGDQIRTGTGASAEITFDEFHVNLTRIEENTLAEFRSIEPTDIFLTDGSIYNSLEGLTKGASYTIATPTAVASVRGTSFLREFSEAKGLDNTEVLTGNLDLAPVDSSGKVDWNQKIKVVREQACRINLKNFKPGEFKKMAVVAPLARKRKQFHEKRVQDCKKRLMNFAGGEEKVNLRKKQFQEMTQRPEAKRHSDPEQSEGEESQKEILRTALNTRRAQDDKRTDSDQKIIQHRPEFQAKPRPSPPMGVIPAGIPSTFRGDETKKQMPQEQKKPQGIPPQGPIPIQDQRKK